jgi:hypothetical protein
MNALSEGARGKLLGAYFADEGFVLIILTFLLIFYYIFMDFF